MFSCRYNKNMLLRFANVRPSHGYFVTYADILGDILHSFISSKTDTSVNEGRLNLDYFPNCVFNNSI